MFSKTFRIVYALLIAFIVVTGAVGPAHAQSAPPTTFEKVKVVMQDGWSAYGRHSTVDDFVVVCPIIEVLDPSHPCSESNVGQFSRFDDLVLVCPFKELASPHPCASRSAQISRARPTDLVLVCPVEEVLDDHPCAEAKAKMVQFEIPDAKVMTCPVKPVLEPNHPCAQRSR